MRVRILPAASIAAAAADIVIETVEYDPRSVWGVATGSSPLATYRHLADKVAGGSADFSRARGFALDEYVGLSPEHPQSYRSFVAREVERPLGMTEGSITVPVGIGEDLDDAAANFDRAIRDSGGVDVQILGIGTNGHIGFNEPGSDLSSRTRVETLSAQTRADNARFFGSVDDVPLRCVTQGLGTIAEARRIVLIATGAAKAHAVAKMIEGPVTSRTPASVLQLHPHTVVLLDDQAAAHLTSVHRS